MKRSLLTLLIMLPGLLAALIHMEAIYPHVNCDKWLVENGIVINITPVTDYSSTVTVYNAENPASLLQLSTFTIPYDISAPSDPRLYNSHLYVPDHYEHRLRRYSLIDPYNPVFNYEYAWNMAGGYRDMVFEGNYLWMATQSLGLRVINIAHENHATEIGSLTDGNPFFRVWKKDNRACVLSYSLASDIGVLRLIDASDPTSPTFTANVALPDYYSYGEDISVSFFHNYMYISADYNSTKVYDVTNLLSPLYLGMLSDYGYQYDSFSDEYRYSEDAGMLHVQSMLDPLEPVDVATYELPDVSYHHYLYDLPYVYLIGDPLVIYESLQCYCLDTSDLDPPEEIVYTYDTGIYSSEIAGYQDRLYYYNSIAQLSPEGEISSVETCPQLDDVDGFEVDLGVLHTIGESHNGCYLYSLSDPSQPQLLSTIPGSAQESKLFDGYLFISNYNTLRIYDLANPANPELLVQLSDHFSSFTFEDGYFWGTVYNEMYIYRLSDSGQFVLENTLTMFPSTEYYSLRLTKHGDYLYVAGFEGQIKVYDISDPANPVYARHVMLPMPNDQVEQKPIVFNDSYLIVMTSAANQLVFYDISDPIQPTLISTVCLPFRVTDVVCYGERVFFKKQELLYSIQLPEPTAAIDPISNSVMQMRNFPNPFNPSTTIFYSIQDASPVSLCIYNIRGQLVKTLVNSQEQSGNQQVTWNGEDKSGNRVASGIYYARLLTNGKTITHKMLILK